MPTDIRRIKESTDVTDLIFLEDWEYIGENDAAFIITFSKRINGREYLLYAYCADKEQLKKYSQLACDVTQYRKRLQEQTEMFMENLGLIAQNMRLLSTEEEELIANIAKRFVPFKGLLKSTTYEH